VGGFSTTTHINYRTDFSRFFIFYGILTGRGKAEYSDCTKKLED